MVKDIIEVVLLVIFGGVSLYFKCNATLKSKASELIADAEEEYQGYLGSGHEKMNAVISNLYTYIPAPFKILFSETMLQNLVQSVFDNIQKYAKTQIDKKIEEKVGENNETSN